MIILIWSFLNLLYWNLQCKALLNSTGYWRYIKYHYYYLLKILVHFVKKSLYLFLLRMAEQKQHNQDIVAINDIRINRPTKLKQPSVSKSQVNVKLSRFSCVKSRRLKDTKPEHYRASGYPVVWHVSARPLCLYHQELRTSVSFGFSGVLTTIQPFGVQSANANSKFARSFKTKRNSCVFCSFVDGFLSDRSS